MSGCCGDSAFDVKLYYPCGRWPTRGFSFFYNILCFCAGNCGLFGKDVCVDAGTQNDAQGLPLCSDYLFCPSDAFFDALGEHFDGGGDGGLCGAVVLLD